MKSLFPLAVTASAISVPETELKLCAQWREDDMSDHHEDQLTLYGRSFTSRLLLGTARYESPRQLLDATLAAEPALLTVSLRRQFAGANESGQAFWNLLSNTNRPILPNTAGCLTPHEAVTTGCMARELFNTSLIKLEVIGDDANLQPDPFGLIEAATELVKLGFNVLPYCTEDWVVCKRLLDSGCEALMPWAAPIGTGQGPRNPVGLRELRKRIPDVPLIVDAGLGLPSHACQVMEWGFDGVLLNTAVSRARDPIRMAKAFADSVRAGRDAFLAGPMVAQEFAVPSTPEFGRPFAPDSVLVASDGSLKDVA
jgi:thiazole synthase